MQRRNGVECAVGVGAAQLDVLPRADPACEVRDGAAEEARAEIEPEHERGAGDRLEEDGAVARPVGPVRRLAHEAGLLERAQCKGHRRLRDADAARDLRTRDGRVGPDRLENSALVEVLEQRRGCARQVHLVRKINAKVEKSRQLDSIFRQS